MPPPEADLILDFTEGGTLPPALSRRLDALAEAAREEFNTMIGLLTQGHERDIDWWVSLPASRNTHAGKLFGKCMQLALVRALLNEGVKCSIHTDDPAFAKVIAQALDVHQVMRVAAKSSWRNRLRDVFSSLFHALSARLAAYRTRHLARPLPAAAALVEVYVERHSFDSSEFRDRYYPGLYESLDSRLQGRFFYLPIFYRIRDYAGLFHRLRRAPQNFFLREDHLKSSDYLFAFGHWWRAKRLKGMKARFAGFEIGPLLDAELQAGRFSNSTVQALLSYRFWRYRAHFFEATVLDWYEGHDTDRATAAGIRWYGSQKRLIAYRGIAPLSYVSTVPTSYEVAQQGVAENWAVVGLEMCKNMKAKFPELSIMSAPGLRHRSLLERSVRKRDGKFPTILVLLSLELHLVQLVGDMVSRASRLAPDCHWLVKRHPGLSREQAKVAVHGIPGAFFIEGSFSEALAQADMVAGLGTNTLIEAAALGVPVICVSGGNMPTELPFGPLDEVWWRTAYDAQELVTAIQDASAVPAKRSQEMLGRLLGPFDPVILRDILLP